MLHLRRLEHALHKKGAQVLKSHFLFAFAIVTGMVRTPSLFAASWNVRSLVGDSGDARVCQSTTTVPCHDGCTFDRKIDFLAAEPMRCRIAVAGIQETKWFGSDVWSVG